MRNSRNKIITTLLLLVLVLSACTQPNLEDAANKAIDPQEKVVARIALPNEGPQTRTILPGKLGQADHYTITFTKAGVDPIVQQNLKPTDMGYVEISGLDKGEYDVKVEGYNADNVLIYTGNSSEKLIIVNLELVASVTVLLNPTIAENTTGRIQVTFDWSSLVGVNKEATSSEHTELKSKGPISTAIEEGTLKFVIYTGEIGEPLVQRGEPIIWTSAEESQTSKTCVFNNIPTGKNIAVAFSILDKNNNVIVDKKYSITAQIFADQTSYWNGSEDYVLHIKSNMDKWYSNISNVQIGYPIEEELSGLNDATVENTVIFTWEARTDKDGKPIYKSILFDVKDCKTGTSILEAPITFVPGERKANTITVTGLTPREEYYLTSETISLGGKHSNTFQWLADIDKGFTTKVEVQSIVINNDVSRDTLESGESFTMSATITPADASYQILTWTPTVEDTLTISQVKSSIDEDVVVTANKPGITRIHVKNNDPKIDKSAETVNDINVRLAQPKNLTSTFERNEAGQTTGLRVQWDSVDYAEEYDLYRSVDSTGFGDVPYQTISSDSDISVHSFLDTDLKTGSTYQYKLVAKAPSIDKLYAESHPEYSATSIESEVSASVEVSKPQVIMKPIDFSQSSFELKDISGNHSIVHKEDVDIIVVDAGQTKKLTLESPVAGFENGTYTWYVNGFEGDVALTGTYEQAKTIELNSTLAGLDMGENGFQELTLAVSDHGETQSVLVHFTVVTDPVKSVSFKTEEVRFATNLPSIKIKAVANPSTATIADIYYRIVEGSEIASIDTNTGAVTIKQAEGGKVVFEAYSAENESITARHTVMFYKPSIKTPEELIIEVNKELDKHITKADGTYENFGVSGVLGSDTGDWWQYGNIPAWTNSDGTISMKANHSGTSANQYRNEDGGIFITNHRIENLGTIGNVTLNAQRIRIWADDRGGAGNLGYDPLYKIGARTQDQTLNKIIVDLPYNQGKATIEYDEVNVLEFNSGDYYITFENDIYVSGGTDIIGNNRYHFGVVDQHDKDGNLTAKGIGVPFDRK